MGNILTAIMVGALVFGMASLANSQTREPRLPELRREQMTDDQKRVYDEIEKSRGG